ncbi:MAG: hypothetical protein ACI4KE_03450, partial [Anaerovoracaceae bacterium]
KPGVSGLQSQTGHEQGAFIVDESRWKPCAPYPSIIFSSLTIGNSSPDYTITSRDTLILSPGQRNLSFTFAALDFTDNTDISYRYRLNKGQWTEIGRDHKLSFFNLAPDTYMLEVCSTDESTGLFTMIYLISSKKVMRN